VLIANSLMVQKKAGTIGHVGNFIFSFKKFRMLRRGGIFY
jgi:hypothetical protein